MNLASDINDVSEENVSVLLKNINRLENLEKEKWIEDWFGGGFGGKSVYFKPVEE